MFTKRGPGGSDGADAIQHKAAPAPAPTPRPAATAAPAPSPRPAAAPRQPLPPQAAVGRRPVEPTAPAQMAPARMGAEQGVLTVGQDISLAGEIKSCDRLVVEGVVQADLNDSRVLEIADSGVFKGTADVDTAEISGSFEGELTCQNRLYVRSTGRITGTVRYGELEVERGGRIAGYIELVNEPGGGQLAANRNDDSDSDS